MIPPHGPITLRRISPSAVEIPKKEPMLVPGKVYVSAELEATLDSASLQQVKHVAALPGIVGWSIAMPDIHIGYGFPIGGVAAFQEIGGIISPGGIGFDINCGVRLLTTNLSEAEVRPHIQKLITLLGKKVPTGTGKASEIALNHEELDNILREGSSWALRHGYATPEDIENTEEHGCLSDAQPSAVSHVAKTRGITQLGTLGAGNHFLEIQIVDRVDDARIANAYNLFPGQVVVLIHCGSRGVGHQICTDYLSLMQDEFPEIAASLPEKNLLYAPLSSALAQRYCGAMAAAANYAWCNRQIITHSVRTTFQQLFSDCTVKLLYDVSHNIAKREMHNVNGEIQALWVHRKGATRSFGPGNAEIPGAYRDYGQPVLIPGSMGTASWVLAGTIRSMTETFGSCCHGAGRSMSRTKALETISGESVRRSLAKNGVHVQGPARGLAEEAPSAYKDVDEVIRTVAQAGLAIPVARLIPLGVLKG